MAFDRHTLIGGALVLIVLAAMIAGISIVGGPGEARKQREDRARLEALSETALALACYNKIKGDIPEDLSMIGAEAEDGTVNLTEPSGCWQAKYNTDPITNEPFSVRRENGTVTQICAVFATSYDRPRRRYGTPPKAIPNLYKERTSAGEHCFKVNLDFDESAALEKDVL